MVFANSAYFCIFHKGASKSGDGGNQKKFDFGRIKDYLLYKMKGAIDAV